MRAASKNDSGRVRVTINRSLTVCPTDEQAVVMGAVEYERLIERLEGCGRKGWEDLWLFGAGVGTALMVSSSGTALATDSPATSGVFLVLMAAGAVVAALCLLGYFAQRHARDGEITSLRKDMERYRNQPDDDTVARQRS